MTDLKTTQNLIHEALAQALLDKVKSGEATAADLNVARQYLKDNHISSTPAEGSPMHNLVSNLPFTGDETYQ